MVVVGPDPNLKPSPQIAVEQVFPPPHPLPSPPQPPTRSRTVIHPHHPVLIRSIRLGLNSLITVIVMVPVIDHKAYHKRVRPVNPNSIPFKPNLNFGLVVVAVEGIRVYLRLRGSDHSSSAVRRRPFLQLVRVPRPLVDKPQ